MVGIFESGRVSEEEAAKCACDELKIGIDGKKLERNNNTHSMSGKWRNILSSLVEMGKDELGTKRDKYSLKVLIVKLNWIFFRLDRGKTEGAYSKSTCKVSEWHL